MVSDDTLLDTKSKTNLARGGTRDASTGVITNLQVNRDSGAAFENETLSNKLKKPSFMGKVSLDSTEKANMSDEPNDKRSVEKFDSLPEASQKDQITKTLGQRMKSRRKTTSHGRRPKPQK